ncbi:MAG: VWA domain-containing protein [Acidimicrobiales bacterium]
MTFRSEVFQNEYLAEDATQVNAIVTVTNEGPEGVGAGGEAVEIILLDCSGSMAHPPTKLREARRATEAAIDCLRDGVHFAVVRGTGGADVVYPPEGECPDGLAQADPTTRDAAKAALSRLEASGGTAIGQWLLRARELFARRPDAIHHAILLTDGKNEGEKRRAFEAAIEACRGEFQCDCRGVGTDWAVSELRAVATALLGSVDIIADPAGMTADFRAITDAAMGRDVGDVALRVWVPQAAHLLFLKQASPSLVDLTGMGVAVNALTTDFPTGAWGAESRDYHLCIEVPRQPVGSEMLAGRVTLVVGGQPVDQAKVLAIWTDDVARSTRINRQVAHYTGQAELAQAIHEGLDARRAGDDATATARIRRAVELAAETGNTAMSELLDKIAEVDPTTGTFQLKRRVEAADEMTLDTRSTKTVRVQR